MTADEANARVEALGRKRTYAAPSETFELDAETLAKYAARPGRRIEHLARSLQVQRGRVMIALILLYCPATTVVDRIRWYTL